MPTGIIEIKLGACLSMPTRELHKELARLAQACNKSSNAMIRYWLRWREDNPDWTPAQKRARGGVPKVNQKGQPVMEDAAFSQDAYNQMYHVGTQTSPDLATDIVPALQAEVKKSLLSKMPYNHTGTADFRWQAILAFECQAPSFRGEVIPVPNSKAVLAYCGEATRNDAALAAIAESSAVLRFPLYSTKSGRTKRSAVCRLKIRCLGNGRRRILRRIAAGELKMGDSKIVFKKGAWYFQMCYAVPCKDHGVDKTHIATLVAAPAESKRPFLLQLPNGTTIGVGDGLPLVREYERLLLRRKTLRHHYKTGGKGHGRGRFFAKSRPYERAHKEMCDLFTKHLVADIVKLCIENNCGSLIYREPSIPLRDSLWLAKRGVPYNWTDLQGRLKFKATQHSIEMPNPLKTRMKTKEHHDLCSV